MQHRLFLALLSATALASPAHAQSFPVTVDHIFGETTIEAEPQRIVSIGFHEQDFLYALGEAPIGVKNWIGDQPYATWPWADAAREAAGAEPEIMPDVDGVSLEWVLAQDPDLIVGIYMPMDEELYAQLSQIAPVVASPEGYPLWGAPWQDELRIIDQATSGKTDRAEAIIADLDARIAAQRERFPELAGATGTNIYYEADSGFVAWGSNDAASRFLVDLGLTFPPELDAMAADDNRIEVSPERFDLLDAMDVVIWPVNDGSRQTQDEVQAMPLYQSSRMAQEGRSLWLDDPAGVAYAAMSFQTPLSLQYLIETLPPLLAAAVDGDPATPAEMPAN